MKGHVDLTRNDRTALFALLTLAIAAPVLFQALPSRLAPDWLGALIGMAALLGVFVGFWRAGAMHLRYLVLFVLAIAAAAIAGRLA
ncbi:MAG: hypothetical protein ABI679_14555 [Gemmatimonadota bacterium]